ncbi:36.4 kDa proline-rich protein-like [Penaeus japonicus]|uniref:36.4 kDa proline-rich protein-like n=1 Tax=Penaeus japonicus TaxID=27405 RepID=UPI001C7159FD|nr:36.4 kDa proline-rich protein-like [Penaeus japonicus]
MTNRLPCAGSETPEYAPPRECTTRLPSAPSRGGIALGKVSITVPAAAALGYRQQEAVLDQVTGHKTRLKRRHEAQRSTPSPGLQSTCSRRWPKLPPIAPRFGRHQLRCYQYWTRETNILKYKYQQMSDIPPDIPHGRKNRAIKVIPRSSHRTNDPERCVPASSHLSPAFPLPPAPAYPCSPASPCHSPVLSLPLPPTHLPCSPVNYVPCTDPDFTTTSHQHTLPLTSPPLFILHATCHPPASPSRNPLPPPLPPLSILPAASPPLPPKNPAFCSPASVSRLPTL